MIRHVWYLLYNVHHLLHHVCHLIHHVRHLQRTVRPEGQEKLSVTVRRWKRQQWPVDRSRLGSVRGFLHVMREVASWQELCVSGLPHAEVYGEEKHRSDAGTVDARKKSLSYNDSPHLFMAPTSMVSSRNKESAFICSQFPRVDVTLCRWLKLRGVQAGL